MPIIKIIIGSTRPGRFGHKAGAWIAELAAANPDATFEVVDLAEINLPLLDEPVPASMAETYTNEHTKAWSKIIGEADGFIFVTPEYNHGVAASLKNAIDYLAKEWYYKPVAFVSYGADASGVRAVEHLRSIVSQLRMVSMHDTVMVSAYGQLNEQGDFTPTEAQNADAERMLKHIAFWSAELQPIRAKLQ